MIAGITKENFWGTLAQASREKATPVSIVVSESCDSGPYTWKQYNAMRSAAALIAHTGFDSTVFGELNLPALDEALRKHNARIDDGLLELAKAAGYWESASVPLYIWPTLALLFEIPKFIYFIPLVVWLAMMSSTLRVTSPRWHAIITTLRRVRA